MKIILDSDKAIDRGIIETLFELTEAWGLIKDLNDGRYKQKTTKPLKTLTPKECAEAPKKEEPKLTRDEAYYEGFAKLSLAEMVLAIPSQPVLEELRFLCNSLAVTTKDIPTVKALIEHFGVKSLDALPEADYTQFAQSVIAYCEEKGLV